MLAEARGRLALPFPSLRCAADSAVGARGCSGGALPHPAAACRGRGSQRHQHRAVCRAARPPASHVTGPRGSSSPRPRLMPEPHPGTCGGGGAALLLLPRLVPQALSLSPRAAASRLPRLPADMPPRREVRELSVIICPSSSACAALGKCCNASLARKRIMQAGFALKSL